MAACVRKCPRQKKCRGLYPFLYLFYVLIPALVGLNSPSVLLRKIALAGYRPHRGRYFAVPVTAAPRRGPAGKIPALVGLNSPSISPAAKPRVRSLAPQGPACSLPQTHFFVCGPLARIPKSHIPAVTHRIQPHLPALGIELLQLP